LYYFHEHLQIFVSVKHPWAEQAIIFTSLIAVNFFVGFLSPSGLVCFIEMQININTQSKYIKLT